MRKRNKITQKKLAEELELNQSTIALFEKEKRDPSIKTILKLSELFEVTTDYLLKGGVVENKDGPDLSIYTDKELQKLSQYIKRELKERRKRMREEIESIGDEGLERQTFRFDHTYGANEKNRYVAQLVWRKRLERIFYDISSSRDDEQVVINGWFRAADGEILEMRVRNEQEREIYIVKDKKLTYLCKSNEMRNLTNIKSYLRGDISEQHLLELLLHEVEVEVLDDLKD